MSALATGRTAQPDRARRFAGRTAIVTGAAGAIGHAIASRLGSEGANLVVADLDGRTIGDAASRLEQEVGATAVPVAGDLSTVEGAEAVVAAARERFARVDVLVNNAGGGVILPTLEHSEETLQATLDRNLLTALRCTLAALPDMRARKYGRIVFVGADSVRNGLDRHAVYNAAKGGVHAFGRGLAREFAQDGITVNTVAPSATATPDLERFLRDTPDAAQAFVAVIPLGRPASLEEVASAVAYLACDEAGFITGQVLSVNGGANMG